MLAMVVAVPLVVAFFIAIAVTLLKRRSDLKRYEGGIATRPRPSSQPPATSQSNATSTNNETTGGQACAVDSPLISITPPVHQYPAEQQQEYQPVPQSLAQPATSSYMPNQIDSNVYLDPAPTGGYYQSHPPPSPTGSSTSASGSYLLLLAHLVWLTQRFPCSHLPNISAVGRGLQLRVVQVICGTRSMGRRRPRLPDRWYLEWMKECNSPRLRERKQGGYIEFCTVWVVAEVSIIPTRSSCFLHLCTPPFDICHSLLPICMCDLSFIVLVDCCFLCVLSFHAHFPPFHFM
ncbi:hypothetical protein BCR44DRAFT_1025509 [Catenaria anguillulae PL171]|uniref:Uncharacterized protein n=1 Tax=Catenaria anguillulae PL171 TaxID=765915 RepID=A0A1Y2HTC5_9FUNG|nr:hypothetical protein BCR44DRAFT_1025509 [Catenaria anguillulae PL171]